MDTYGFGFSVGIGGPIDNTPVAQKKAQPIAIPPPKPPAHDRMCERYESKLMIQYAHLPEPIPYNYGLGHEVHMQHARDNNQAYHIIPPLNCSPTLWEEIREMFGCRG